MSVPFARSMLTAILALAAPAVAARQVPQTAAVQADPALGQRAAQLIPLLNGEGDVAALFAPSFLTQVPEPQICAISI